MTKKIILAVALGIAVGYFLIADDFFIPFDLFIDIGLMLLLFFVGIGIGLNRAVFSRVRRIGFKIFLIPVMMIIGSISGAMIAGIFLHIPYNEAGAIGAGLGWYSLSSILLASYSNELATLAFVSNVVREVIGFMIIPIVASKIGFFAAIAPAGAAAMDTGLPIIAKATDSETTILAFISGAICTLFVPILVPIVLNL